MKNSTVLGNHMSSRRDAWWYLEQDEDGSLWVRYENEDQPGDEWRKPLAEVLANPPSMKTAALVQERIERMFAEGTWSGGG
ncbi:hypothetical protein GCM10011390_50290 [Aureimonas endophytica]|uniref:Uncharacterized protein n=1 Tax=Aureimonas endophytica TaxID=2027858 RepID=A0A917A3B2_9HYPH|nr:hypothetical protein [Aureimonas endophytica]GGE24809.1 hypothetical protein GCM10011390_50290 [Aureimonas endophytica]